MNKNMHAIFLLFFTSIAFVACNHGNTNQQSHENISEWKMGIALYSFHQDSFTQALEKAERSGVTYVEGFSFHQLGGEFNGPLMAELSDSDITRMREMLQEKGMEMKSMYVGDVQNEEEWNYYFHVAQELGMEYLVAEPPTNQLDMLDRLAGVYGVRIAIHEHAKGQSIYWHPDSVIAAMQGRPNIGVCADLGHWVRSGLDPVECLKKLENRILGVHLKDAESSGNIKASFVNVGEGVIDFPGVIEELKRQNFNGFINVECEHHVEDNLQYVIHDIQTFKELVENSTH